MAVIKGSVLSATLQEKMARALWVIKEHSSDIESRLVAAEAFGALCQETGITVVIDADQHISENTAE